MLRRNGLPMSERVDDVVESLYAYAALRCGVSAAEIVAIFGRVPVGMPLLALAIPRSGQSLPDVSDQRKKDIADIVSSVFSGDTPRWFAMRLRQGVRFESLERKLSIFKDDLPPLELFYPTRRIARRLGRKVVFRSKPFIADIVFFKARITDIIGIFAKIGDIAWCYTIPGDAGRRYAEISRKQFERFQQTIARFTPDYEVGSIGDLPVRPDERVVVVGGLFTGLEATITGMSPSPVPAPHIPSLDTPTLYRLKIIGDNGIEWRISSDSRLIQPIPNS